MEVAVVTGFTGDIGGAAITAYLEKGYRVCGLGRDVEKCEAFAKRFPGQVDFLLADLSDDKGIQDAVTLLRKMPAIHSLINCAGVNIIKPLENVAFEDFDKIVTINLKACYFLSQVCSEKMKEQGFGRIVNISSIWGTVSKEHRSLYSSSKSGLNGLTRALAVELAINNILVNSISPGFIDTQLTRASLSVEQKAELISRVPLQRLGKVQEIAELIYFFGSSKNTFVTGQNIVADGGFSIV